MAILSKYENRPNVRNIILHQLYSYPKAKYNLLDHLRARQNSHRILTKLFDEWMKRECKSDISSMFVSNMDGQLVAKRSFQENEMIAVFATKVEFANSCNNNNNN